MPLDLTNTLFEGISKTVLFDLSESDQLFSDALKNAPAQAIEQFRIYILKHEDIPLESGTGFPLVSALLGFNQYKQPDESPLVEVVVILKNSPDSGLRALNSIRHHKLDTTRSVFYRG